jgi:hypothetical protein
MLPAQETKNPPVRRREEKASLTLCGHVVVQSDSIVTYRHAVLLGKVAY